MTEGLLLFLLLLLAKTEATRCSTAAVAELIIS
jgi:hypothetical protein